MVKKARRRPHELDCTLSSPQAGHVDRRSPDLGPVRIWPAAATSCEGTTRRIPPTAGETSGLSVELSIPNSMTTPILATYQAVITVPPEFTFLGFDALGSGAVIGAWEFDFFGDGDFTGADFTIDHRSIDANSAYSDSDASGAFSAGVDPTATHTLGTGGEHIITMILPNGGIVPPLMCSYFSFDARYTLLDGIVELPATPGEYLIQIMATSVDLDTGNATDNMPPNPLTFMRNYFITVPEPEHNSLAIASLLTMSLLSRRSRRRHRLD